MKRTKKLTLNKWFNAILLIGSLLITITRITKFNTIKQTLTWYGRLHPLWFKIWGLISGTAVYYGIKSMCDKYNIKNKILDLFTLLSLVLALVTVNVLGTSLLERRIHYITAAAFGVVAYFCILYVFNRAKKTENGSTLQYIVLLVMGITELVLLFFFGLNAFNEIFLTVAALGCVLNNILFSDNRVSNEALDERVNAIE